VSRIHYRPNNRTVEYLRLHRVRDAQDGDGKYQVSRTETAWTRSLDMKKDLPIWGHIISDCGWFD
jgi:hypothetical protein